MKKTVSTRFYVENEGIFNQAGESLEQAFVQLQVDGETVKTYTIKEYRNESLDLWNELVKLGYDLDSMDDEIGYDPFEDYYKV